MLLGFHRKFLVRKVGVQVSEWLAGDSRLKLEEETAKDLASFPQELKVALCSVLICRKGNHLTE